MSQPQRRLGRGLEALLSRPISAPDTEPRPAPVRPGLRVASESDPADGPDSTGILLHLPIERIDSNPFQPRRDFDEAGLDELAQSLREHGLLQPLVVRRSGDRYQLVAGERRLRAAIKAGWAEVPAQIHEADDREMAELAIVENLQRRDLNPLEKAVSFQQYLLRYGVTQADLAARLKIDRSTVANLIRLLELPDEVQQSLRAGAITQGHARALLPLGDDREQTALCERIAREQLSVRAVEELVQTMIHDSDAETLGAGHGGAAKGGAGNATAASPSKSGGAGKFRSQHVAQLEQQLRAALGTKVSIRQTVQGRGKIAIAFRDNEEFERIRDLLCASVSRAR